MAVDYVRVEETTTTVRYVSAPSDPSRPLDATTDVFLLLRLARQELNESVDPHHPRGNDRDPGYGTLWIEPAGDVSDGDRRLAVCFTKVVAKRVDQV
jgi:hypothetical protein